jgi:hypothetical protein
VSALIAYLEQQVESSRRLLGMVLGQGQAIRRQDVGAVLARLGDVQVEMAHQQKLERDRERLMLEASSSLAVPQEGIDLEALLTGRPTAEAARARALSAELQGLVREIGRVHDENRVLMRQELTFLNHLIRVISGTPQAGYSRSGWSAGPQLSNAVDTRA